VCFKGKFLAFRAKSCKNRRGANCFAAGAAGTDPRDPVDRLCKSVQAAARALDSARFGSSEKSIAAAMFYTEDKRVKTRLENKQCGGISVPLI
jgi:hypothetical protein